MRTHCANEEIKGAQPSESQDVPISPIIRRMKMGRCWIGNLTRRVSQASRRTGGWREAPAEKSGGMTQRTLPIRGENDEGTLGLRCG